MLNGTAPARWSQCCGACGPGDAAVFLFAGLNPETLSDPCSAASYILARLNAAYDKSVAQGYAIAGLYVDGMVAFNSEFTHINYRDTALHHASNPPVYHTGLQRSSSIHPKWAIFLISSTQLRAPRAHMGVCIVRADGSTKSNCRRATHE